MSDKAPATGQSETEETRKKILAAIGRITKMKPGALTGPERLEDLDNWDSLAALDFLLEAQIRFNTEVPAESLGQCLTVEDLVNLVVGTALRKAS